MAAVVIVALAFLFLAGPLWLAIPLAVVSGLLYLRWDVRRHQSVACRVCRGSGSHISRLGGFWFFRKPFGDCRCCGGRKAHPRLAAIVLDPAGYREIQDKIRKGRSRI